MKQVQAPLSARLMSKEAAFRDASALVPLCVHETASRQPQLQLVSFCRSSGGRVRAWCTVPWGGCTGRTGPDKLMRTLERLRQRDPGSAMISEASRNALGYALLVQKIFRRPSRFRSRTRGTIPIPPRPGTAWARRSLIPAILRARSRTIAGLWRSTRSTETPSSRGS
jgi:hypothetical protein